jgi:putative ABC transport system permease protein
MWRLAFRNLRRRPLRSGLTVGGLSLAVATLLGLTAIGQGYQRRLRTELDRMGVQLMLVPLGCPYDAAARVLKGRALDTTLPGSAIEAVRADPDVAVAAPLLTVAVPRPEEQRTDLWAGVDEAALALKPWWKARAGAAWFTDPDSAILGAESASAELREPGDSLHCPESGVTLRVAGVLARSGTADDSMFFVPLATAQRLFGQPDRLTAIAIRLRDPDRLREASSRLQRIPGAQVVTLAEMMGAFLNLLGTVRTLVLAIGLVAVAAAALTMFNTLLAAVLERRSELALLRALGASAGRIFALVALESLILTGTACAVGGVGYGVAGAFVEALLRRALPLAPIDSLRDLTAAGLARCVALALGVGLLSALYPAWRAAGLAPAAAVKSV